MRLPPSAFDMYPDLQQELDDDKAFASLTPNEALAWARTQQVEGLRGRDPKFFGTPIKGEHLGFVGPVAISILHVYLLIMLCNLRISIRKGSFDPTLLPWVATSKELVARAYSGVDTGLVTDRCGWPRAVAPHHN